MSSMSLARRKRLAIAKQEKRARVFHSSCAICKTLLAGKTKSVLQARLTQHYREKHPSVFSSGGTPVLAQSETRRERPEHDQAKKAEPEIEGEPAGEPAKPDERPGPKPGFFGRAIGRR